MLPKFTIALTLCAMLCLAHAVDLRRGSKEEGGPVGNRQGHLQQRGGQQNRQGGSLQGSSQSEIGQREGGKDLNRRGRRDINEDDELKIGNQGQGQRKNEGLIPSVNEGKGRDGNQGLNRGGLEGQGKRGNVAKIESIQKVISSRGTSSQNNLRQVGGSRGGQGGALNPANKRG